MDFIKKIFYMLIVVFTCSLPFNSVAVIIKNNTSTSIFITTYAGKHFIIDPGKKLNLENVIQFLARIGKNSRNIILSGDEDVVNFYEANEKIHVVKLKNQLNPFHFTETEIN